MAQSPRFAAVMPPFSFYLDSSFLYRPKVAMTLHPMITFSGNCRMAMEFYRHCFGGHVYYERLPVDVREKLPARMRDLVLNACLTTSHFTMFASDLGASSANGRIALLLTLEKHEFLAVFEKLSERATKVNAIDPDHPKAAAITDRFGIEWLFRLND